MGASFHIHRVKQLAIFKNKGLWNFVPNSGLGKFRFGIGLSIVETCYDKVDAHSVINLTVVGKLS